MKLSCFIICLGLALTASQAIAFSEDDKTGNNPDGSARFSDPDEKTPGGLYMQGDKAANGNVDPSTIRYDYDPASGSYIPHKQ